MTRWALGTMLVLPLLFGCGRNIVPKQLNEPCTRTAQCEMGLQCTAGVCQPIPDAGADGGP